MSGTRLLHRGGQVEVRRPGQLGVDAALHAHLGRAEVPGLRGPVGDLVEGERVGVGVGAPLGERAEPAADVADVGEVDVAVDDVGDLVADRRRGAGRRPAGTPAPAASPSAVIRVSACSSVRLPGSRSAALSAASPPSVRARRDVRASGSDRRRVGLAAHRVPVAVDGVEVGAAVVGAALGVDGGVQVGAAGRVRRSRRRAPARAGRPGVRRAGPGRRAPASAATWARPAGRATARRRRRTRGAR